MALWAEYNDAATQATALAALVAGQLAEAIKTKGHATLAVPGGTTPALFLRILSAAAIDWSKVRVLLTDERAVPETSARSNTNLLRATLLQNAAAAAHLVPLYSDPAMSEGTAETLQSGIRRALPIDVCVLGMGADMHTASLFPGADRLNEALDPDCDDVLIPMQIAGTPEPRVTLTARVLRAAPYLHLLLVGAEKLAALKLAERSGPAALAPVRVILTAPGQLTVHYTETAETT